MRIKSNIEARQTFPPGPTVNYHNQAVARILKFKRGVGVDSGICGCNHSQTLADRSQQVRLKEKNDALGYAAAVIERASRPTEKLDPPVGQPVSKLARSDGKLDKHLWGQAARLFDPPHNNLEHVVAYIQKFAADLLNAEDVQVKLTASLDLEQIQLTKEQCHQLVLIFEAALQNIAAYADCSTVSLAISIRDSRLAVEISDDGSGLIGKLLCKPAILRGQGRGLRDVQMRMAKLGGAFEIASAPGQGTRLTLKFPLHV